MKKYQCKQCGHFFYGMDSHFGYDENVCEECGVDGGYEEVAEKEYTVHDYGIMLDDELENANYHSICGIGEAFEGVITANIVNDALAKKVMKLICEEVNKMI